MKAVVSIDNPCAKSQGEMGQREERHSSGCNRFVNNLNPTELQHFVRENWGKKIYSPFSKSRVDKVVVDISDQTFFRPRSWRKSFVLAVFLVFGSSLISGTSYAGNRASFYINSTYNKFNQLLNSTQKRSLLAIVSSDEKGEPDQAASFPGGNEKLMAYLHKSMNHLQTSLHNQTIYVQFNVDVNGNLNNIGLVRKTHDETLNLTLVDVVANMPAWNPAVINNKKVASKHMLPIHFSDTGIK